jgi:hypothetical protein
VSKKQPEKQPESESEQGRLVGFLGVGLDNRDGEQRLTRSEHFVLIGGSHETHERMQDAAIRFADALKRRGKKLHETDAREASELLRDSME